MSDIKARLLSLTADRCEAVEIPNVGTVYLHAMSEIERANFEAVAAEAKDQKRIKRLLICMTCRASDSKVTEPIFSGRDISDMGHMDSAVIDKLATTAMKVCGIGEVDLADLLKKPASDSKTTVAG